MRNVFPFLQQGVSSDLKSVFELLETTEIDGQNKYSAKGHQKLMLLVVCRNYSKALLELCYLIVMVVSPLQSEKRKKGLYHFFFGISPAAASQYSHHFGDTGDNIGDEPLRSIEVEGGEFSIYFSRMPVLVELMELMITLLDYREIEGILTPLMERESLSKPLNKKLVSEVANALSAQFYQEMNHHLPAAQQQRKYQQIAQFMLSRHPDGFRYHQIGDDEVLEFWKAFSEQQSRSAEDFVKYASVLGGFMDFYRTSKVVYEMEVSRAYSSHESMSEGEIAQSLHDVMVEEEELPLEQLSESPVDRVKFLNKRELDQLRWLFESPQPVIQHFMCSCLRSRLFGSIQNQLIEQLRRREGAGAEMDLLIEQIMGSDWQGYQPLLDQDQKLSQFLQRLLFASLHPLFQREQQVTDWGALIGPEESEWNLRKRARSEFSKISRKGFEKQNSGEQAEIFIQAIPILLGIRKRFSSYQQWLQQDERIEQRSREDQRVFKKVLKQIYQIRR
ncbi:MAG: hypothetical protein HN842_00200 [Gammaproteobacteria bacterium]|jgi:hypothetical protein|nr:hypothetical protein [Gammaproteobacteria bacterium]MBT7306601.1 hypothetical protein [Gammaproteobacteria bacterium]